jgi:toxin ParE1/3/4
MTVTPYPYLVFYEATDAEIIIHAVRHAARDPSGMPGSASG